MYTTSIIHLITWPILVVIAYFIIAYVIKKYEQKEGK